MSADRYTTARVAPARAGATGSAGTYDGAELRRHSNRPGAYDALALPSRGTSRERTLAQPTALTVSVTAA
jgi:hypothetical protein